LAKDDGSKVEIKTQTVQHWYPDFGYVQYVKICNKTNSAKSVYVTSSPYTGEGKKREKIGNRKIEAVTIPANKCVTEIFSFTKKITGYYTDVYENDGVDDDGNPKLGERLHFVTGSPPFKLKQVLCLAYHRPARLSIVCAIAYPRSLESSENDLQFYVRKINGLPKDWKIISSYPKIGTPFVLTPDNKEKSFLLELSIENRITEQVNIDLDVEVAVKNRKLKPPFTYTINLPLVNKFEGPTLNEITSNFHSDFSSLIFNIDAEDEMSLLDRPIIFYSKDNGKTWDSIGTKLLKILSWGKYGIKRATFGAEILTKDRKSPILASVVLNDVVGNDIPLKIQKYPNKPRKKRKKI